MSNKIKTVLDGWVNFFTGLGMKSKDKRVNALPQYVRHSQTILEEMYASDDIAKKIINRIANDATRKGIEFQNLKKDKALALNQKLKELNTQSLFNKGLIFARLYGGAGLFINFGEKIDGPLEDKLREPVDENKIINVRSFTLFNRFELKASSKIINDITSPMFGMPVTYDLQPRSSTTTTFNIHESRIIRFEGTELPTDIFVRNNYWNDSVLEKLFNALSNFNQANDSIAEVLLDFRIGVMKIKGLMQKVGSNEETEKSIRNKIDLFKLQKSILGMLLIDTEDEFEHNTHSVAGIEGLINKVNERMVAASDMPHTLLFGESPSGLGATGQSELRDYYDFVAQEQERVLRPAYEKLFNYIFLSKEGPTNGKIPEGFGFTFKPLWQLTDGERAKMELDVSQKDKNYIELGVLTESEVALSRYGGNDFTQDTVIGEARLEELKNEQDNFKREDNTLEQE